MSDVLGIGSSAVQVYQRALATVSNNVANMATEGYTRQEAVIKDNSPRQVASLYFGTGSRVAHVQRVYDAFVEAGLRASTSDLETQVPLVNYTNRVVDVMGSQVTGLSSALDSFFASARSLSNDAVSIELRSIFLSEADGLADRFRTLSGQFEALDSETREAVTVDVGKINTLASQIAQVNAELSRKSILNRQAPQLLDQRDQLLRELSLVAKVKIREAENGVVDVSLGTTDRQGQIVSGRQAFALEAVFDERGLGSKLVIDPVGRRETLSGISSGNLGGLLAFRNQVLGAAVGELDFLAESVAGQVNATHRLNMTMRGELGGDVFTIDPVYKLDDRAVRGSLTVQWDVIAPGETRIDDIELIYDHEEQRWTARDLATGESTSGVDILRLNGMQIRIAGQAEQGDRMVMEASNRPSTGIRRLLDDPRGVAAAASLRVIEAPGNASGADAVISWQPDLRDELNVRSIASLPISSPWQSQGLAFENSSARPASLLGKIEAGMEQVRLELQTEINQPLDLQILTRDGRHIAGRTLTDTEQAALISPATGFVQGASYSDDYLNSAGDKAGYLDLEVFYGVRAVPAVVEERSGTGELLGDRILPASFESRRIPAQALITGERLIASGALSLNGEGLVGFTPTESPIGADHLADWLQGEVERLGLDEQVRVEAFNELRVGVTELDLDAPLAINGVMIVPAGAVAVVDEVDLARLINLQSEQTGVLADLGDDGALVLRATDGRDIVIQPQDDDLFGETANALAIPAGRFAGQLRFRALDEQASIHLGLGEKGTPGDLARLGFSTGVWIDGAVPEDLIVLSTGSGSGLLSAQFNRVDHEALSALRARDYQVEFTDRAHWKLTDLRTGTVLAERAYDPVTGIHYRGVQISLSRVPEDGDVYRFDGNQDGVGDNAGIVRLAALEKSRQFIPGGRTISESWLDRLNQLGNLSNQASIAQTALQVVHDQAVEARDRVSGVSLDEEAADLIRFQQAYQASTKVIQMANQLFDAIANIR